MNFFKKTMGGMAFFATILSLCVGFFPLNAMAATITSYSVVLSRLKVSELSNQEIKFVTPTGVGAGGIITLTYSGEWSLTPITEDDVDFAIGTTNNCTSATFNEAATNTTPSGATWGIAKSGQVITLTSGTGTVTADRCVRFRVGTNAVSSGTGANQITNPTDVDDDDTVVVGGSFGDTGTSAVDIITDDQVVVTATVQPTLTFAISDNTIEFGNLSASDDTFADNAAGNATEVEAHTLAAGTNAAGGYIITLTGNTLTDGAKTITAIGASNTATSVGSEQFGVRFTASGGSGAVTAPYAAAGFAFDSAAFPDEIAASTIPSATTTYSARYIANIASNTEAGSYSATLTYVATGSF
ncbi:MAG: hypothetical protein KBC42_01360 [Candidatus Pacebacteria bacterium]|nr:hypothetical protein [Candidatus Paceibacterota bacterium]MBP9780554.1 hypothetical protein [Candidatus Paceibacterota bacterium]